MGGKKLSRKDFIRKTSLGVLGAGLATGRHATVYGSGEKKELRQLGKSGIRVSSVGFGASRTQEEKLVLAALDAGINFLDTGRSYANGQNEVMLGKALRGKRDRVVIQSKLRLQADGKTGRTTIHKQMEESLKASLAALQTGYIDIMLIHGASRSEEINNEHVMECFDRMKSRGDIRLCGFSSHSNQVALLGLLNRIGFYDVAMLPFNPFGMYKHSGSGREDAWDQDALVAEMKTAHGKGISLIAMKTTSGGPYADREGVNPSFAGAIRWVVSREYITSAAVAMANFSQIAEDAGVMQDPD